MQDAERKIRHEALRQSRLALEPVPPEPEAGDAAESGIVELGVVKKNIPRA